MTVTATAAANSVFVGFGGDPDCADGVVTLTASLTCAPVFAKIVTVSPMVPSQGFDLVLFERVVGSTTSWP